MNVEMLTENVIIADRLMKGVGGCLMIDEDQLMIATENLLKSLDMITQILKD